MAEDIVLNIEVNDQDLIDAGRRVDDLTASITELEQETKSYKESNKELQRELDKLNKTSKENSELTEDQERTAKKLKDQIVANNTVIALNQQEIQKNRRERTASIKLMDTEQGTRARLRQKVAELNKELSQINTTTAEGRQEFDRLADEMKSLNNELNEGSIQSGNFKDNIGNYPQVMGPAVGALELIQGGLKGMIKQSLAFIATPLGAVLVAITAAVGLFSSAMSRSASSQAQAGRAAGTLKGVWSLLLDSIGSLVDDGFKILNFAIDDTIFLLTKLGVIEPGGAFDKRIKQARELEQAEQDLLFAEKDLEEQQLRSQIEAERFRQVRDDESKTIDERIKANEQLGIALDNQLIREQTLAKEVLRISRLRADVDGKTVENLLAIRDAEIKLIEIQERIEAQRSEQLTNRNSLLREKATLDNEAFNRLIEQTIAESELNNEARIQVEENEKKEQEILDKSFEQEEERNLKRVEGEAKTQDALAAKFEEGQRKRAEIEKQYAQKRNELLASSAEFAGQTLGNLISNSTNEFQSFSKSLILIALDFTEKLILLSIAEITAKQIASKGILGIATSAILVGIVKGVFAGIKSQVSQSKFEQGGSIINGPSHASGGIDVFGSNGQYFGNVEGGESMFVLKKNATDALNLSNLNQAYGGRSFYSKPERINQDGGQLAAQTTSISPAELKNLLESVQIVVGVKDIITGIENRVQVLENANV